MRLYKGPVLCERDFLEGMNSVHDSPRERIDDFSDGLSISLRVRDTIGNAMSKIVKRVNAFRFKVLNSRM